MNLPGQTRNWRRDRVVIGDGGFELAKVVCECGSVISDSTDLISQKARFIADQDFFDYLDEVEKEYLNQKSFHTWRYFGDIFQCSNCGNLMIYSADYKQRYDFRPINQGQCKKITQSYLGENWKGTLVGHFYGTQCALDDMQNKGDLYWDTNRDSGFLRDLCLAELKEAYFRKFNELQQKQILRSSFLTVEGKVVHIWPEKSENPADQNTR